MGHPLAMIVAILIAAHAAGTSPLAAPAPSSLAVPFSLTTKPAPATDGAPMIDRSCKSDDPLAIMVCGKPSERFRIDPTVLSAMRAHDAPPPKTPSDASQIESGGCVGPSQCTGDGLPLVAMALVAAKAVALDVDGDDWREAFRTHADEYRLYQEAEARRAEAHKVTFGVGVRK